MLKQTSSSSITSRTVLIKEHNEINHSRLAFKPENLYSLKDDMLIGHNKYRKQHNSPNLITSETLNKLAQDWAEHLMLKGSDTIEHSNRSCNGAFIGESIAIRIMKSHAPLTADEVLEKWYCQSALHEFGKEPKDREEGFKTAHFTQIVWRASKELGIGICTDKKGRYIVVCNYFPPGNQLGSYLMNVERRLNS